MDAIVLRLEKIKKKVEILKTQNEVFSKQATKNERELERLNKLVEIQNNSIKELEKRLKVKEMGDAILSNEKLDVNKRRELKHKLNEMIREVDKVISIISA